MTDSSMCTICLTKSKSACPCYGELQMQKCLIKESNLIDCNEGVSGSETKSLESIKEAASLPNVISSTHNKKWVD